MSLIESRITWPRLNISYIYWWKSLIHSFQWINLLPECSKNHCNKVESDFSTQERLMVWKAISYKNPIGLKRCVGFYICTIPLWNTWVGFGSSDHKSCKGLMGSTAKKRFKTQSWKHSRLSWRQKDACFELAHYTYEFTH